MSHLTLRGSERPAYDRLPARAGGAVCRRCRRTLAPRSAADAGTTLSAGARDGVVQGHHRPPSANGRWLHQAKGDNRQAADCDRQVIQFARNEPHLYDPEFVNHFQSLIDRLEPQPAGVS